MELLPLQENLSEDAKFLSETRRDLRGRPRASGRQKLAAGRKRRKVKKRKCYGANRGHYNVTRKFKMCPALKQFVTAEEASRGQIVKAIWDYIKAKNLQCKGRGRVIVPDKRLSSVIGEEGMEINAFTMMTYIEKHLHHRKK